MKYFIECKESEATHEFDYANEDDGGAFGVIKEINRWNRCEFEEGQGMHTLYTDGIILSDSFHPKDSQRIKQYNQGNVFATKEEAETERDKRTALATIQRYLRATQECRGKWINKKNQGYVRLDCGLHLETASLEQIQIDSRDLYFDQGKQNEGLTILRKEYEILFGVK